MERLSVYLALAFALAAAPAGLGARQVDPAPGGSAAKPPRDEIVLRMTADVIVLRMNGEDVSRVRYEDWLIQNHGELDAPAYARSLLLRERAEQLGVLPNPADLRARALAQIESRVVGALGGDRERWVRELARERRTPEGRLAELLVTLETDALLEAITQGAVPSGEDELIALWEERYGPRGRSPRVRLLRKRFVVPFEPGENTESRRARTERLRVALRGEMEALLERTRAGESFAALVASESDHPSKDRGGLPSDDAWRRGFPGAPLRALALAQPGTFSEPVYAGGAFWIVRLESLDVTPLEDVRAALEAELDARATADERGSSQVLSELLSANPLRVTADMSSPVGMTTQTTLFHVGTRAVKRGEYAAWLRGLRGEREVERFALEVRLRRRAEAAGVVLRPGDLAAGVERARATEIQLTSGGDEAAWLASLQAQNLDEASWGRAAQRRIELEGLEDALARMSRALSEEELRHAWQQRYGPGGQRTRVRWIQLRVPAPPVDLPEARRAEERERFESATLERADALRSRVLGGEDFATLAREHSEDTATAAEGGAAPEGFSIGSLPEELRSQLAELESDEMTSATLVEGGAYVVLLQLVARELVPFEAARAELEALLLAAPATLTERALVRAEIAGGLELKVHTSALLE